MNIYIQPSQLNNIISVKKFKQHSESLQSLLSKVQSDLYKRYTPFNPCNFAEFAKDLNEGMSLISLLSDELMFDLKYSNMEFLVEPFKRINGFASNILNTLFTVFEGCYQEYLRIVQEFEKASESWLPLQFLLKEGMRLDQTLKDMNFNINSLNLLLPGKSQQQQRRDIEEMNDTIQQKKLYLKYLSPVTQGQLMKMEDQIQKISELTKNIIDHTFKGLGNGEEILNKAWSQELLTKWKQNLIERLKQIVSNITKIRKDMDEKDRKRMENLREQQTQTVDKSKKSTKKPAEVQKLQKLVQTKTAKVKELENQINQIKKNFCGYQQLKKLQQQKKREEMLTRQFAEKNERLDQQLNDLKSECLTKEMLLSRKLNDTQNKLQLVDLQLSKMTESHKKQTTKIKQLEKQIEKLIRERQDEIKEFESSHCPSRSKKESICGKQQFNSLSKIGSFNSLDRTGSMRAFNRMSRDLRNIKIAEKHKKSRQIESRNFTEQKRLRSAESQESIAEPRASRSSTNQNKFQEIDEKKICLTLKSMKQVLEEVTETRSSRIIQHGNKRKIELSEQGNVDQEDKVNEDQKAEQQQKLAQNSSSSFIKNKSSTAKSHIKVAPNQLEFKLPKEKQSTTKSIHRKGIMKDKGMIHRGNTNKKQSDKNIEPKVSILKQSRGSVKLQKIVRISENKPVVSSNNSPRKIISSRNEKESCLQSVMEQTSSGSNFLDCKAFITHKSTETQTVITVPKHNSLKMTHELIFPKEQTLQKSLHEEIEKITVATEQIIPSKKRLILPSTLSQHSSFFVKQTRQPSLQNTFTMSSFGDKTQKTQQNPLVNAKLAVLKNRNPTQLTEFCRLNITPSTGIGSMSLANSRFSHYNIESKLQNKATIPKQNNSKKKLFEAMFRSTTTQSFKTVSQHKNKQRRSETATASSSKLQQTMSKFLKLLKTINPAEYDLFVKSLHRLNKYQLDEQQNQCQETSMGRRLLSYLSSNQKCDNCLILRIFVEKMESLSNWFENLNKVNGAM